MIPVPQRIVASGGDGQLPGDCVKCCVASILELPYEDVPHFVAREVISDEGKPLEWLTGINVWLKRQGYTLWLKHWTNNLTLAQIRELRDKRGLQPGQSLASNDHYHRHTYPDYHEGYWIASVISENFEDSTHAIVMLNDQVAFDPSTKPRRTPYEYIGGKVFIATDPAAIVRRCRPLQPRAQSPWCG